MAYYYRLAMLPQDEERIHQLNYKTFVEEIPQHAPNEDGMMVDRFHAENTYVLCMKEQELVGMIALRSVRPFSLDEKIGPIEEHLANPPNYPVEIRLLAIDPAHRTGRAFFGMMQALVNWCLKAGFDAAVISGTVRELKLYRKMGYVQFAEPVGTEEAKYVPMIMTMDTYEQGAARRMNLPMVNLLPGPVSIAHNVRQAMMKEPLSHRSPVYARLLKSVTAQLRGLTGANHVQLLQGTGTLANDAVAAQLSRVSGRGLVLVNGEFGQRLTDHAQRFGLSFDCLEKEWGESFSLDEVERLLRSGGYDWIWLTHLETSTGVVNDLAAITALCHAHGIRVAVDCASSLGTIPVDLTKIHFASSVSGKGLASYAGFALVFHIDALEPDDALPRYLDIGLYASKAGIPFTQSSNLLAAMHVALGNLLNQTKEHLEHIAASANRIRKGIRELDYALLTSEEATKSSVITLVLPEGDSSKRLGDDLFVNGFRVHYESKYLVERNWLQIAVMEPLEDAEVERLLEVLKLLKVHRPY